MSASQIPRYHADLGEFRLACFVESPTDERLANLTRSGALAGLEGHEYTVLHFAKRASVHLIRSGDPSWFECATSALDQIEWAVVDSRDVDVTLGVMAHGLWEVSEAPRLLWNRARGVVQQVLAERMARVERSDDPRITSGYRVVRSGTVKGLMRRTYRAFDPTTDLVGLALRLTELLDRTRYASRDPEEVAVLPGAWFERDDGVQARIEELRATVSLGGWLRGHGTGIANPHRLIVFVSEARDASEAAALATHARRSLGNRRVRSVVRQNVLATVIAGSFQEGVGSKETSESLGELVDLVHAGLPA